MDIEPSVRAMKRKCSMCGTYKEETEFRYKRKEKKCYE